ncbi:MAG TPA: alpha-amylase [Candidatus Wirthbacteria bacterium]|nr:alpha-amylase [Candidatus Wirthbacteria bacterium]
MQTAICFYFQVHQPFRLRPYTVFDVGRKHNYFDEEKNESIMRKVATKCYLPTNALMLELTKRHPEFKIAYSISGVALEQFEKYAPDVLESFQKLVATGQVEILSETYYHSLAFLYSKEEFLKQVDEHKRKVKKLFKVTPQVFRNTELIYNNELAKFVQQMGYKGIITEGADRILDWRSPNFVYTPAGAPDISLLLKNYKLSDDIAFRFSNRLWNEYPLKAEKYVRWLDAVQGETINLFMDYETFGEHQWEDTGIFQFMEKLPSLVLKNKKLTFKTPSEVVRDCQPVAQMDIHHLISWADMERDLSAWLGNKMQQSAIKEVYLLEKRILQALRKEKNKPDGQLKRSYKKWVNDWKKLQTSDHFYYMCTKWFSDGDVHKYFNPYDSPYEAYITFMNVLNDLVVRLEQK